MQGDQAWQSIIGDCVGRDYALPCLGPCPRRFFSQGSMPARRGLEGWKLIGGWVSWRGLSERIQAVRGG